MVLSAEAASHPKSRADGVNDAGCQDAEGTGMGRGSRYLEMEASGVLMAGCYLRCSPKCYVGG